MLKIIYNKWVNLSIARKIGSGFLVMVLIAGCIGFVAYYNISRIKEETTTLTHEYIPAINESFAINQAWAEAMMYLQAWDLTGSNYYGLRVNQKISSLSSSLEKIIQVVFRSEQLRAKAKDFQDIKDGIDILKRNISEYELVMAIADTAYHKLTTATDALSQAKGNQQLAAINEVNALIFRAKSEERPMLVAGVESKLQNLKKAGNLYADYSLAASAFSANFVKAKKIELERLEIANKLLWEIRAISDIGLDNVISTSERTNDTIKAQQAFILASIIPLLLLGGLLLWAITRAITVPLKQGIEFAKSFAEGDLTSSIAIERKDEIGILAMELNIVRDNIREIIGHIMENSRIILNSSSKLKENANLISDGSKQQAAAAEEISSSMEEMYANIQQNTENAKQTQVVADSSAKEIIKSKESFQFASQSLRSIIDKVTIINDIAFQTNLLALNAAIEAARAQEFGKGFAVVANEVKKLADKSKLAANEINDFSNATMNLSENAKKELEALAPEIQQTAILIQEIAVASTEQVTGVEQINSAMQMFNIVVQDNAQRAEELTQRSEELSIEAEKLENLVSKFKL
jgi:methyl-accepting chemotaxis protein